MLSTSLSAAVWGRARACVLGARGLTAVPAKAASPGSRSTRDPSPELQPESREVLPGTDATVLAIPRQERSAADGEAEISAFLTDLAVKKEVSASTQNQAQTALLFLYRDVLRVELDWVEGIVRARRPVRLPLVLSREETVALLAVLVGVEWLMATLLYGAGLRLLECCRMRVEGCRLRPA